MVKRRREVPLGRSGVERDDFGSFQAAAPATWPRLRDGSPDDPIQNVYDVRAAAQGIPVLGSYADAEFGNFGPNPATNPNFTHLATGPTTVPGGRSLEGVSGPHAHSQYPQQGNNHQPRTSGYNIAAVIAGLTPIPGS